MVEPGIQFGTIDCQEVFKLVQSRGDGRGIRFLNAGVEPDKGSFDLGFGHDAGLELNYLNQRVGLGLFRIHPPALALNQLVSAEARCSHFCPTLTITPRDRQAVIPCGLSQHYSP